MKTFVLTKVAIIAISQNVLSQNLTTKGIAIFKDGSSFVVKSGKLPVQNASLKLTSLPLALSGTLWVQSPNNSIKQVVSFVDSITQNVSLAPNSLTSYAEMNVGKKMVITHEKELLLGTLIAVKPLDEKTKSLIIKTLDNKWVIIKDSNIQKIELEEMPNLETIEKKIVISPTLRIDFNDNASEQSVVMSYLQKGLSWNPFYQLDLKGDKQGILTLRAEVINNAENIEKTDINFVVGVPNFNYAKILSPLVSFQRSRYADEQDLNPYRGNTLSNARRSDFTVDMPDDVSQSPNNLEDLYFYPLPNVTLKTGERGHYQLYQTNVDVAHVYETILKSNQDASSNESYSFSPKEAQPVFHSIRLKNNSNKSWTTGVVMVVKTENEQILPLSQDLLTYTPVKSQSFIKVTESPDIKIKQNDREIARITKKNWDEITVEGQITIKNFKAKPIEMNIRRHIVGQPIASEVAWKCTELPEGQQQINKKNEILWELPIQAGEERILKYSYKLLVPTQTK